MWNSGSHSSTIIQGGDKICVQTTGLCGSVTIVRRMMRGPHEGKRVGLTNAHLFEKKGDVVYLVSNETNEKGVLKAKRVGKVLDMDKREDTAIFEIESQLNSRLDYIHNIGAIASSTKEAKEGDEVVGYSTVRQKVIRGVISKTQPGNLITDTSGEFQVKSENPEEQIITEGDSGIGWVTADRTLVGVHSTLFPHPGMNPPISEMRSFASQISRACARYDGFCPLEDKLSRLTIQIPPDARNH